ncbi:Cell division septal protein FtsQ [Candidatus Kryptobacter tengchongensis]|uniref:Cell division septal protein FtsQ n=1 Tax=Kryptobacter tengchongensis TaxID=1643429 RepID=A0A656D6Y8_KRYT1|nr:FtsQ-type POTRA domain-containing protein [Candidatus Kryptobacter tengchongensis]CUT01852.1 Cell division septal protein FtsQ [Candidatus Kryptobacter tengchongensis]CUU09479.1 Cell division septal protein FtsQ [Candidatus Kryptobacter tengchongensis]
MRLVEREIKMWTLLIFIGFMLVLVFGAMNWRENRVVNKIIVKGNKVIPDEKITELADVKLGVKISEINLAQIRRKVERHSFIKYAEVYTNLPDVLFIEVLERKPIAMTIYGGRIYYIDLDGKIIPFDEVGRIFAVPLLSGINYKPVNLNSDTIGQIKKQFELIKNAIDEKVYDLISEVRFENGEFILFTSEGAVMVFLGGDKIGEKLILLREFWTQVVPERGYPIYIDLRYDEKLYAKFN